MKKNTQTKDVTLEQFDRTNCALEKMLEECTDTEKKLHIAAAIRDNTEKRGVYVNTKLGNTIEADKNIKEHKRSVAKNVTDAGIAVGTTAATIGFARMVQKSEHLFASDGNFYDKISSETIKKYVIDPSSRMIGKLTDLFRKH